VRRTARLVVFALRFTDRRRGVALVYHALARRSGDPEAELVAPHGERLFEHQLGFLARAFRIVDAAELPAAVAARRRGERFPAAVTFDDDLSSHVSTALPILLRHEARATFFLTGATLAGPSAFWWQRLQHAARAEPELVAQLCREQGAASLHELARRVECLEPAELRAFEERLGGADAEPGLRAEDVRALVDAAMAIGFHTRRHRYLPLLPEDELAQAFEEGRAELERLAGGPLTIVAYPHGAGDERVAAAARTAGFDAGYTGRPRAVRPGDDPLLLGRLSPSHRSAGHLAVQLVAALLRR
jgi:peptidoglycan/xylan/chitin deacetylase (PgdA/CDA1 family)